MNAATLKLLVIEDDANFAELVTLVAEQAGYSASLACGFDELERAFDDSVKLIVLDMMMPEMDGVEVIRFLAAHDCQAGLVLFSSVDERILETAVRLAQAQGLWVVEALPKSTGAEDLSRVLCGAVGEIQKRKPRKPKDAHAIKHDFSREEINRALQNNEFLVLFQPKIAVATKQLVSVEALVRWQHPQHGLLTPGDFVYTIEEMGFVDRLTGQVMDQAFAHTSSWAKHNVCLQIAINVSALMLANVSLPDEIARRAKSCGVEPTHVILEITESWLATDVVTTLDVLTRLRLKGFELSIDDFGTGYSTLSQLRNMPFSELKLDQSFVRDASSNKQARTIADSSAKLGRDLNLRVVAEGVETLEDWNFAVELGCDMMQGLFIAAPMDGQKIPQWHRLWRHRMRDPVVAVTF